MGMVASGLGFLSIGLWQAFLTLRRSSSAAHLVFIAALAFVHIISGLIASHVDQSLADGVAMATPLERSSVAIFFLIFPIAHLLRDKTPILPLPQEFLQFILLLAFGHEFLLFFLQRPDAGLESRYYSLLLVPIGVCLLSTALGIAYPSSLLPPLARSMALVFQGTWLIQMGLSFFTAAFMPKGCSLKQRGEGDYVVTCAGMFLMRGKAVATLQFNCHMALLLAILLPLYGYFTRKDDTLANRQGLNYERLHTTESYELKRTGDERTATSPASFSLESYEDEPLPDGRHEGNGFQNVGN